MKLPIEVHNKLIPFKGFSWITWLAFAFTRKPKYQHMTEKTRRHEGIHCAQQIELAVQEAEERMQKKAISAFDDMWFENGEDGEFEPDYEYHRRNFIQKLNENEND